MTTRVLFPETGFTTADAARYYRRVARWMLPHLQNVPLSFKRYPDTIEGQSFWEKDAPGFTPEWVRTFAVPRRDESSDIHYIVAGDVKTLTWIAEAGGIEIHPFLHRIPKIGVATAVVFDLDPGSGASLDECRAVALLLRETLGTLQLRSFAKVSGSKGLQVYVPLNPGVPHALTEPFARLIAEELARRHPELVVATMAKALRRGKVFIDYTQNADYKTTVAVYSLRAKRERPLVSMPVTWEEVETGGDLEWAPDEALARLRKIGDLFAPMLTLEQTIPGLRGLEAAESRSNERRSATARRRDLATPKARTQSGRRPFSLVAGAVMVDKGTYEVIEGSLERGRLELWFSGATMKGAWILKKRGRAWRLTPKD